MLSDRSRGNGHKLKHRKSHLNIRKHFVVVRVVELCHKLPTETGVSILADPKKPTGHGSEHPPVGDSMLSSKLEFLVLSSPCEPMTVTLQRHTLFQITFISVFKRLISSSRKCMKNS